MTSRSEAKRTTRSGSRTYELPDGSVYPSVTTILSVISRPALVNWAAKTERELVLRVASDLYEELPVGPKMGALAYKHTLENRLGKEKAHARISAKALDVGRQAHALIEWELRRRLGQEPGPQPEIGPEAQASYAMALAWLEEQEVEPLHIEQIVWSRSMEYAGTLDLYCRVTTSTGKRVTAVVDWKTGKAIYPESILQACAYSTAWREMGHAENGEAPWGMIVRLPKSPDDPSFEVRECNPDELAENLPAFMAARELWAWQNQSR